MPKSNYVEREERETGREGKTQAVKQKIKQERGDRKIGREERKVEKRAGRQEWKRGFRETGKERRWKMGKVEGK